VDAVTVFKDRRDAGRQLAGHLDRFAALRPIVLGMPRGGVPVAAEVAERLSAPLGLVRKIGCPWHPELGIGAIAEGGVRILNDTLVRDLGVRPDQVQASTTAEEEELARRVRRYRGNRAPIPVEGRTVILVDDGLATGYTARAAIETLRQAGACRVILAVPVAPQESVTALAKVADEVVVVDTPPRFFGVGQAYRTFAQTSDEEVVAILERAARPCGAPRRALSNGSQPPSESTETRPR
jgi:putative phosphoribosyl transferase